MDFKRLFNIFVSFKFYDWLKYYIKSVVRNYSSLLFRCNWKQQSKIT